MLQSKIFGLAIFRTGTILLAQAYEIMKLTTKHFTFELYQNINAKIINKYIGFVDSLDAFNLEIFRSTLSQG